MKARLNASAAILIAVSTLSSVPAWSDDTEAEPDALEQQVATQLKRAEAAMEAAREQLREAARQMAKAQGESEAAFGPMVYAFDFGSDERKAILGVIVAPGPARDGDVRGVRVQAVTPGSGADAAGIKTGDLLLSINGKSLVVDAEDGRPELRLREEMTQFKPGDRVKLEYEREGKTRKVVVEATQPPSFLPFEIPELPEMPALPDLPDEEVIAALIRKGPFGRGMIPPLQLASMDADLAEYFRTPRGVLVVSAPSDDQLHLKSGDVIREIDGEPVNNPREALEKLGKVAAGETVHLEIVRHGKKLNLEAAMPDDVSYAGALPRLHVLPAVPEPPQPPQEPDRSRSP